MASSILLVEDDQSLREGLRDVLASEGYRVTDVGGCEAALAAVRARTFDLLLLDVMLPDGNGIDLLKQLRAYNAAPALFLTARDDELSVVKGLDAGGDDYVTKPFRLRELLSRIRALLRRAQGTAEDVLQSGGLRLFVASQLVEYRGAQVRLTPTECALLVKFLRNPNRTLTRAQLLQSLWDDAGEYVDDNNLSVHVSHIREKLPGIALQTVRGAGYRWEVGEC